MPPAALVDREGAPRGALFFAHFLVVLATWTVIIKFLLPFAFALAEDVPLFTHVMWDFWWVAHLYLAWALVRRPPYLFVLGMGIAVVEIAIVAIKFVLFLSASDWTIWTMNWFVNKIFVIGGFSLMLPWLLANRARLAAGAGRGETEALSPLRE